MRSKSRSKPAKRNLPSDDDDDSYSSDETPKKGLDVFEFDEYDGFDDTRFKKLVVSTTKLNNQTTIQQQYHSTPKPTTTKRRLESDNDDHDIDDGFDMPLSTFTQKYRSSSNKRTRSQRKTEPEPTTPNTKKSSQDGEDLKNGKQETNSPPGYKIYKRTKKSDVSKEKSNASKHEVIQKPTQNVTPVSVNKVRENNDNKNVVASEKQILRERIKSMLLDAGWTIDYRPRKNRDYKDAVYITPTGTGYWSIVKAYDAFKKMEEDNSKHGADFTPLPHEVLGKLTRQTPKKMETPTNNKRKNEVAEDDDTDEKNVRKSRKLGRSTLLVRGSDKGVNSANGFQLYSGKRSILSWLIDSGVVDVREHVEYINPRKTYTMQKGSIMKDGILCGCCSKIVTFLKFEEHSGSKLGDPFPNIILKSGKSLMQCQIDAWEKLGELEKSGFYTVDVDGDDPNDDTCGLCGDGGDLICCDGCPSTFHQSCLDIEMIPEGDWHCPNCPCKYCATVGGKTEESLLTCGLCQKKYHESCRPELDVKPNENSCLNLSFCGHKCHELYSQLQKEFAVKHQLDSGFSWSLVRRSDLLTDASSLQLSRRVECNSMLAVAMPVMDECFLPVNDRKSKTNLIRNVVFNCGSNISRLNYSGFFTAILERGDEVVCAASIRIHGTQLAEMPFIGTRHVHRRKGMCRRLLSAIELALSSLHVEKLIIPAVTEHMTTWTDVFGFRPLEESHKQEMRSLNMLVFPGTDMLQKPLVKQDTLPEGNYSVLVHDVEKPELISSDVKDSSDKTATTDSGSQEPGDHGCSLDAHKENLPINSPVKDEMPLPVVAANSPKIAASIKIADDADSDSAQVLDVASRDTASSDIPCEHTLLVSVYPHLESNVEETTTAKATDVHEGNYSDLVDDIEKSEQISFTVKNSGCKKDTPDSGCFVDANKEAIPSNSPVKDEKPVPVVVANSSEMVCSIKIADNAVSSSAQILDVASCVNPHEPTVLASVDPHVEIMEETTTAEASDVPNVPLSNIISSAIPCEYSLQIPVSEPELISSDVEKSEQISSGKKDYSDKIAITDSGSQEPGDHGCSVDANKESLPSNSPVTDKMPVPVLAANSSEMVSSIKNADDAGSRSAEILDVASCDTPCESKVLVSLDPHVESNMEETTTAEATDVPLSNIISSATPCESVLQIPVSEAELISFDVEKSEQIFSDVKDSSDKTATTDSGSQERGDHGCSVDANKETLSSNSPVTNEMPVPVVAAIKIADDAVSRSAQSLDVASRDTFSSDTPREHKAPVSVDPHVESNVEETTTAKSTDVPHASSSNIISSATPCESALHISVNGPVSTNLHSDTDVGELAMQNSNETNVKTMSTVEKLDIQNGCDNTTDNISLEAQSPPKNVSSYAPLEQESPCLVSEMPVTVEESSADVILETGIDAVKDNVKLSEGKKGLYGSEIIAQETV